MFRFLKCNKKVLENLQESRRYCQYKHENDLMLSVADSDFQIPDGMKEDLIARINQGNICYTFFDEKMREAINKWYKYRFNLALPITTENIVFGSGVIHLMQTAMFSLTNHGDGIIVQPPVYEPFYEVIKNANRQRIDNKLIYDQELQQWSIDFADLEVKMADPKNKLLFLCSPHNPVGRVWSKAELTKIITLAVKYDVYIISDEAWQDIIFAGTEHIPLFAVNSVAEKQVFVISSQAKTYNLGGAQIGYGISFNNELVEKIKGTLKSNLYYTSSNYLSACSLISGYNNQKNIKWYEEYSQLINQNYLKLKDELEKLTKIKVSNAQGLYLLWLDMSQVVANEEELILKLKEHHLSCHVGSNYGSEYWYFLRVDYAVCPSVIEAIIKRFTCAFS